MCQNNKHSRAQPNTKCLFPFLYLFPFSVSWFLCGLCVPRGEHTHTPRDRGIHSLIYGVGWRFDGFLSSVLGVFSFPQYKRTARAAHTHHPKLSLLSSNRLDWLLSPRAISTQRNCRSLNCFQYMTGGFKYAGSTLYLHFSDDLKDFTTSEV